MNRRSRIFSLLGAAVAITTLACAEVSTEPIVKGAKAPRDTTEGLIQGDTLQCRSGWVVSEGRYVCT